MISLHPSQPTLHMERVKGQQLHLRRVLEKQLEELEHNYRQTEAKRDREIRSLGVDLTKLKTFTKDVDQMFGDDTSRPLTRRASLPSLSSPRPLTSPANASRLRRSSVVTPSTRSRYELSGALTSGNASPRISSSLTLLDFNLPKNSPRRASNGSDGSDERGSNTPVRKRSLEQPSTTLLCSSGQSEVMTHDDNRRGSTAAAVKAPSTQVQPARRGSKSGIEAQPKASAESKPSSRNTTGMRRSSLDNGSRSQTNGKSSRRGSKTVEAEVSHNETKVYVHRDGQEPVLVSECVSVSSLDDDNEDLSPRSMFERRNSRRASEPAVGGHFLRELQAKANGEDIQEVKPHHTLSPAEEELRKSIAKDLPSQIVAEEDEDRYNEENNEETVTDVATSKAKDSEKSSREEMKPKQDVKSKKTEIPSRRESPEKMEKARPKVHSAKASVPVVSSVNAIVDKKPAAKPDRAPMGKLSKAQQRRKSDGDVLRFARIWKLQAENNRSSHRETRKESYEVNREDTAKMGIWDAVRKCRYIRGYNPPEMDQPEDLSEFVFDHPKADSVITTK